jgi:hypothetical protein
MTTLALPTPSLSNEDAPQLNVVFVYEDFVTGLRARQAFERALEELDLHADFNVGWWRFDLISDPIAFRESLAEAAAADIVFVSAHGSADLPAPVRMWTRGWLARPREGPCALVVSLDSRNLGARVADRIVSALQTAAAAAGVDVITQYGEIGDDDWRLAPEDLQHRADAHTALLDGILGRPDLYSHWGINE